MQYNGIGFCNGQQPITVDVSGIPMQHLNNFFQPSQESLSWISVELSVQMTSITYGCEEGNWV